MRGLFKRNKKATIIFSFLLIIIVVGIASVTSNASVNRYDEWMKKYLEYRAENKDLTNDQIAAMVDEEMKSREEIVNNQQEIIINQEEVTKTVVTENPKNTPSEGNVTKPVVTENPKNTPSDGNVIMPIATEIPDATTFPAVKTTPKPKTEQKKNNTSPCDCEECIAFYAIYQ